MSTYLIPDILKEVSKCFLDLSNITLDSFLSKKFAVKMQEYIKTKEPTLLPDINSDIKRSSWKVAKLSHKYRFLYQ